MAAAETPQQIVAFLNHQRVTNGIPWTHEEVAGKPVYSEQPLHLIDAHLRSKGGPVAIRLVDPTRHPKLGAYVAPRHVLRDPGFSARSGNHVHRERNRPQQGRHDADEDVELPHRVVPRRPGCVVPIGSTAMATGSLETNHGAIGIELFDADAPKTVANFVKLSRDGYYDGVAFHRVIQDFMIQGGDPTGTGMGGPGYQFEDEINKHPVARGALAMANAGPNTNGSQFFIVTADACPWLDGLHTVFGRVTSGMDVVETISNIDTDMQDRPLSEVRIESVSIED
ncbi:MAG TPA: peptidylprolyl isomerase [Gaiellaceae bacterium]